MGRGCRVPAQPLVVILAGAFLAVGTFVALVLAAGALAGLVVVLAAVVLAVVFDAALAAAALVSLGAGAAPRTTSLKPLRGVMRAFLEALVLVASPVGGVR